jgi:hypothetical protein
VKSHQLEGNGFQVTMIQCPGTEMEHDISISVTMINQGSKGTGRVYKSNQNQFLWVSSPYKHLQTRFQ